MAHREHIEILKTGIKAWNKWRTANPLITPNLSGGTFRSFMFREANLCNANLSGADLRDTNFRHADLSGALLNNAKLFRAYLSSARLDQTSFREATLYETVFADVNLSTARFLETCRHKGPSVIDHRTIAHSVGLPIEFLRGCGLSDVAVEFSKLYNRDLGNDERNKILSKMLDLQVNQAIQVSPLFISYSHGDSEFVNKIDKSLTQKGIRFWRDIHEMKAGRIETQVDRAITQNRTVLLVLSENSLKSDWVEHEVRTARGLEKEVGRDVLCPIALDDSWKSSPWPARVMEQIMEYNILDFSAWEDDVKFEGMFRKLIDGLELFYKDKLHGE